MSWKKKKHMYKPVKSFKITRHAVRLLQCLLYHVAERGRSHGLSRLMHAFCAMNLTCSGHDREEVPIPLSIFLLELYMCLYGTKCCNNWRLSWGRVK